MTFEDFKDREWRVLPGAATTAKHTEDDIVSFDGEAGKVKVRCERYGHGQYKGPTDGQEHGTIEGDGFTISITAGANGKDQITFTPTETGSVPVGGSWTAEDTSGGVDGGG
jgi:hypothetical protein